MPGPRKTGDSLSEVQKQLQKRLAENEEVSAAIESAAERAEKASRAALERTAVSDFAELGREIAARLLEQHQQKKEEEESEAQRLQAGIRWIEEKWGEQPCPYCEHVEWQVGTPLEISLAGEEVMSPAFPVMCGNCGHTTFVNAIRAGLNPESDERKE